MAATPKQKARWTRYKLKLVSRDISHRGFAAKIGISEHHLRMVIYGERPMMPHQADALAEHLDLKFG